MARGRGGKEKRFAERHDGRMGHAARNLNQRFGGMIDKMEEAQRLYLQAKWFLSLAGDRQLAVCPLVDPLSFIQNKETLVRGYLAVCNRANELGVGYILNSPFNAYMNFMIENF